jgi:hypothetical protein
MLVLCIAFVVPQSDVNCVVTPSVIHWSGISLRIHHDDPEEKSSGEQVKKVKKNKLRPT